MTLLRAVLVTAWLVGCTGAHRAHGDPDGGMDATAGDAGFDADAPHVQGVVPSNHETFGELEATGLALTAPSGAFDTDTACTASSGLGTCTVVAPTQGGEVCVCRVDTLTISSLTVTGTRALALLAHDSIAITGVLELSAHGAIAGPGAGSSAFATTSAPPDYVGGAGGGNGTDGGSAFGSTAVGAAVGTPELIPLTGGTPGQAAGNATSSAGGGGGALQLTAGRQITATGSIRVVGGGGHGGGVATTYAGAGGGGAGGSILVEAPAIHLSGALDAAGGGGGGGGGNEDPRGGGNGDDGGLGGGGDDGAGCPLYGYVAGGDGGAGSTTASAGGSGAPYDSDSRCLGRTNFVGGGGGGGGAGRIRINTTTGCECGGAISPTPSLGTVLVQ